MAKHLAGQSLFKTKMCSFYKANRCRGSEVCTFAHSLSELVDAPDFAKTSFCRDWQQKKCPLSSQECRFAHGREDLRRRFASDLRSSGSGRNSGTCRLEVHEGFTLEDAMNAEGFTAPLLWDPIGEKRTPDATPFLHGLPKISFCRNWQRQQCPLSSDQCPFAHGEKELHRSVAGADPMLLEKFLRAEVPKDAIEETPGDFAPDARSQKAQFSPPELQPEGCLNTYEMKVMQLPSGFVDCSGVTLMQMVPMQMVSVPAFFLAGESCLAPMASWLTASAPMMWTHV